MIYNIASNGFHITPQVAPIVQNASVTIARVHFPANTTANDTIAVWVTNNHNYHASSCFDDGIQEREDEALVDSEACEREWPRFRRMLVRGIKDKQFNDLTTFLLWFLGGTFAGADLFPHLSFLLRIVCVLPVGSCANERSFSRMKCAKTRLRNALGEDKLEPEID